MNPVVIGDFDWEKTKGKVASTHPQFETMADRHDRTPIFKLIDFGLAQEMKVDDLDRMTTLVDMKLFENFDAFGSSSEAYSCRSCRENLWLGRKNGKTGYIYIYGPISL